MAEQKLRIALPKGRMSDESLEFFSSRGLCSLSKTHDGRELILHDEKSNIDFYLIRSKDVGAYVEQGAADLGIMGLYEKAKAAQWDAARDLEQTSP